MRAILTVSWIGLKRDRIALGVVFLLPLVFFSIFALIFGGGGSDEGGGGARDVRVAAVDLDGSEVSRALLEELGRQDAIELHRQDPRESTEAGELDRDGARRLVREGTLPVALILPAGFSDSFGEFAAEPARVELIFDSSNPLARGVVGGLVQAAAFSSAPDVLMTRGLAAMEAAGGTLTPEQRLIVAAVGPALRGESSGVWGGLGAGAGFAGLVAVDAVDVRSLDEPGEEDQEEQDGRSGIAYYAAGIGVMFLLFSAANGAGSLLDDDESGVLERMLNAQVPMSTVLLSKWTFFLIMGVAQVGFMFTFGALAFGLEVATPHKLTGLAVMILATAAAASAFGIALACLCRSRAQLSGISTIVILVMSALGGSMVPRFVMPAFMETTSLFTFNGWALDGFLKVLWYDDPHASLPASLARLAPEVGMLLAMTALFLFVARLSARRWESL